MTTVSLLAVLFVLVLTVPIGGLMGAVLFGVVVVLVGILFFRFGPEGDFWARARDFGINPWLAVALVLVLAAAVLAFRVGLLQAL